MTSKKTPSSPASPVDQLSGKQALQALFSGVMFLVDFAEEIEQGRDAVQAVKRAKNKTRRRTAALKRAELEEVEEPKENDPEIVVEVKKVEEKRGAR